MEPKTQKPVIIFISNRFGYGPTTALLHVVREFIEKVDADFVFAGSGICKEAFDFKLKDRVEFIEIDERDYDEIKKFLLRYKNRRVFLISCLNRLAILVAKELEIPNALVDLLTWMWNEIPNGYKDADYYFSNHFGTKNKKPYMIEVPIIMGSIPDKKNIVKKKYLLVNIGGMQNHLVPGLPENYLRLISYLLNNIKIPSGFEVVVASGNQAVEFLKKLSTRPEFRITSLSFEEYTSIQNQSKKIISLAGSNSTFMAFILGTPVVFLLPQLYSHWKLTMFLKQKKYIKHCQHWDDYMPVPADINSMTEKDIIFLIEKLSAKAFNDKKILDRMMSDLQNMIDTDVDTKGQDKFIADIGIGGEKKIFSHLNNSWFA